MSNAFVTVFLMSIKCQRQLFIDDGTGPLIINMNRPKYDFNNILVNTENKMS